MHSPYRDRFCPEVIALLTKMGKTNFLTVFLHPPGHILPKIWDFRGEVGGVFGPNVLLALRINPCKFQENVNTGKKLPSQKSKNIWAKIGCALKHCPLGPNLTMWFPQGTSLHFGAAPQFLQNFPSFMMRF